MKLHHTEISATYRYPDRGEMNHRITVRRRTDVPGTGAGFEPTFPEAFKAWAKIAQVGATAYQNSMQINHTITHRITLDYRRRRTITTDHEVVFGDTVFKVKRIIDINNTQRFWVLECEALGSVSPENYLYAPAY